MVTKIFNSELSNANFKIIIKMPIFHKKNVFKAPPPRTGRVSESQCPRIFKNSDDLKNLHLTLANDKELRFVDGMWIQQTTTSSGHSVASRTTELNVDDLLKLKGKMDRLEQENNLLQVKVDILIDLLTENLCKDEENKQ